MPRRARADIGRRSRRTQNRSNERENQSQEQREQEIANTRERIARSRSDRRPTSINQNVQSVALNGAGFRYNHAIDYSLHNFVVIGGMNKVCQHCNALKFHNETPGMCCASGKVRLPELQYPPEPLATLISGTTPQSKHFLDNIQMYNSCFQMTSFGATNVIRNNFMPTFKVISASNEAYSEISELFTSSNPSYFASLFQIQGQIYHRIGSLLPFPDANHQFLQIYFLGHNENEVDARCSIFTSARRIIICELQAMFHEHNDLINTFRTALDQMPSDDHKIVIRADRRPIGEHERRFNAPINNEVAVVIVGDEFQSRDIVLRRRNNQLQRVCETHRSYDALQYPILFCRGEDGYSINLKIVDPANPRKCLLCLIYSSDFV